MHSRAARTPLWRARRTHRTALVTAITTAAVVIATAPGLAAPPKPELPKPESPWTKPTKVEAPATPAGSTKPPASRAEAEPSAEVAAWRVAQKARATGKGTTARSAAAEAAEATYVPEGQGEVPWHQILDTRLDDALVARANVSNGNLMDDTAPLRAGPAASTARAARADRDRWAGREHCAAMCSRFCRHPSGAWAAGADGRDPETGNRFR